MVTDSTRKVPSSAARCKVSSCAPGGLRRRREPWASREGFAEVGRQLRRVVDDDGWMVTAAHRARHRTARASGFRLGVRWNSILWTKPGPRFWPPPGEISVDRSAELPGDPDSCRIGRQIQSSWSMSDGRKIPEWPNAKIHPVSSLERWETIARRSTSWRLSIDCAFAECSKRGGVRCVTTPRWTTSCRRRFSGPTPDVHALSGRGRTRCSVGCRGSLGGSPKRPFAGDGKRVRARTPRQRGSHPAYRRREPHSERSASLASRPPSNDCPATTSKSSASFASRDFR